MPRPAALVLVGLAIAPLPALGFRSPIPTGGMAMAAEDSTLLEQLRRGDAAAFEQLVRENIGPMLIAARRILKNEDDAREAVQDAFLSAFRSIERFTGDAKLSTWLHRIAINAALMKLRARNAVREKPIDDLLPRFDDAGQELAPNEPWAESAEELASQAEARAMVRMLIDELPDTYRVALLLRDIEELSTEEVAKQLDVTPNAVKIRIHRARQALRALLDARLKQAEARHAAPTALKDQARSA